MSEVVRLTFAYLRQHLARLPLTVIAIMAAACLVIWVLSGYDALVKQYAEFSRASLGRSAREGSTRPTTCSTTANAPNQGRDGESLLGTDAGPPPFLFARGPWIDSANPDALKAAVSGGAAGRLGVDLGGEVQAGVGERGQKMIVVSIVDTPVLPGGNARVTPEVRGPRSGGLYVLMILAE